MVTGAGHDKLELHGAGKHLSSLDIDRLLRFVCAKGLLDESAGCTSYGIGYATLSLSMVGWNVLKDKRSDLGIVLLSRRSVDTKKRKVQANKKRKEDEEEEEPLHDHDSLHKDLLSARDAIFEKACNDNEASETILTKPWHIVSNKALEAIAIQRPADVEALGDIVGVGHSKAIDYGEPLLRVVALHIFSESEHCETKVPAAW